jgi:2-polyprenyl-3-methyl-5-hydroxy-6-metoxy-1,4-benzoquinol methylase
MNENLKSNIQERWVSEKEEWKSIDEFILFLRHKKAYQFASDFCQNKNVLDYGCGSGYGTALLANRANETVGVDINEQVIDFCVTAYNFPNLLFQKINNDLHLPFKDKHFDVVVSFQVIEHIPDVQKYLLELKRLLKDDGILFIATPNKKYRLLPFQKPWNRDHIREYSLREFNRELAHVFSRVEILGVYGTDEINSIEYNRVKQRPFQIYIIKPLKRIMRIVLPSLKHELLHGNEKVSNTPPDVNLLRKYSLNDIIVGNKVSDCLEFLAICYKK